MNASTATPTRFGRPVSVVVPARVKMLKLTTADPARAIRLNLLGRVFEVSIIGAVVVISLLLRTLLGG